jgi:WD40 repeat protein
MTATKPRPVVQRATASGASVVIQVGRDLYVSDASLRALWAPGETAPGECPFPGLDAFGPAQARWFFGRQGLTGELLELLDTAARSASGGPVLVVGPSGAGKSSLLGAGLLAALAEGRLPQAGSAHWPRLVLTPGAHPAAALAGALAASAAMAGSPPDRTVIVVDQLEEIFTACQDEAERSEFLGQLAQLAAGPALVVLGLRADFYARATAYPVLRASMGARQLVLGAMSASEVSQAVTAPARAAGLTLENGLAERLLYDLGTDTGASEAGSYEPGRLPLLAYALRATWQRRDRDLLTVAGYQAAGGISGAVAKSAEQVYAGLDQDGQRAARQVFLALVRVGEEAGQAGSVDTRRRVNADRMYAVADNPDLARAVVSRYTDARLLTSGGDAVQITHEALLRSWPRLRDWLTEDRAGHLLRQDLEEAAATWDRENRDTAGLYGGARLAAARAWASGPSLPLGLSRTAREFLTASDRRRRRGIRQRNAVIAMLTALSVGLATVAGFALVLRSDERSAFNQAEAGLLSDASNNAMAQSDPGAAMQLALLAYRLQPASQQARSALLSAQTQPITGLLNVGARTKGKVFGVAYSPGGSLIAASTSDNFLQIWSASAHRLLFSTKVAPGKLSYALHQVTFSRDGKLLAVTGPGGAWLYHVAHSGKLTLDRVLGPGADAGVTAEAFSPDGRTLAVAVGQSDGTRERVQQWNVAAGKSSESFPVDGTVAQMTFAAGGRLLVTSAALNTGANSLQGTVAVRDAATGVPIKSIPTSGSLTGLAVSQQGGLLAFADRADSKDVVELWSLADLRQIGTPLTGFAASQSTLAFSPEDGTLLATGGQDDVTRLWDVTDPDHPVATFDGSYPVESVAFSPDGHTVASGGDDGLVTQWDVQGTALGNRVNSTVAAVFSPDGHTLALATISPLHGPGIALYAMPGRKLVSFLPTGSKSIVSKLAYSRDGRTLAAAVTTDPDLMAPEMVQLWNPATGRQTSQIATGQAGLMRGLAFSRDGTLLATTSESDASVRVWSTARGNLVKTITAIQGATSAQARTMIQWDVVFSPNGRLMAVPGGDGRTRVYSVPGYQLVDSYLQETTAWTAAFSPDGRTLAIGDADGAVYLYAVHPERSAAQALQEQRQAGTLSASTQPIAGVVFTADGKRLIAAGYDGTVRIWNVPSRTLAATISAGAGSILALAYDSTRQLIVTGSSDEGTHVWQASPETVAASVCPALQASPMSQDEWSSYVPGTPYLPACE